MDPSRKSESLKSLEYASAPRKRRGWGVYRLLGPRMEVSVFPLAAVMLVALLIAFLLPTCHR